MLDSPDDAATSRATSHPDRGHETRSAPGSPDGVDPSLWDPARRALTIGLLLTVTLVALESLAVATVMPEVRSDLGGYTLYGWVFSGFFLASILGIVAGGQAADQHGLAPAFAVGVVLFGTGLVIAGLSTSMAMLVGGRLLQGLGAGIVPAVAYAVIARAFPTRLRPKMFALLSTAWVVPGLIGPALAAAVEHALSWRWVFLGLLPVVVVAGTMTFPALLAAGSGIAAKRTPSPQPGVPGPLISNGRLGESAAASQRRANRERARRVLALVAGVGAVFVAASGVDGVVGVGVAAVGAVAAVWAFIHLVPPGTVRLRRGVPATVAVRGLLTWCFFQADAYISLAVVDGRHATTWMAGAALSAGSVLWACGSWLQSRQIETLGPRRLVSSGLALITVSILLALGVSLGLPVVVIVVAWAIGGFGMGMAYAPLALVVLAAAKPGEEGAASAALQLSDVVGVTLGTGLGGALVGLGDSRGWAVSTSVAAVFATAALMAVCALAASSRLPTQVVEHG